MTNILVTAMLLTGGSAAFTALSGIPTAAACFLLPLGVITYTTFGGIKATFLTVSTIPSFVEHGVFRRKLESAWK
jgi:Na+/proline symporter